MLKNNKNRTFCRCENSTGSTTEINDFGCWDVCADCGKPVEDSFQYFNHFDGEDQIVDWD